MATSQLIPIEVERLTVPELNTAIRIVQDRMYIAHVHGRIAERNQAWERLSVLEQRLAHAESSDVCLGRVVAAVDSPLAGPINSIGHRGLRTEGALQICSGGDTLACTTQDARELTLGP